MTDVIEIRNIAVRTIVLSLWLGLTSWASAQLPPPPPLDPQPIEGEGPPFDPAQTKEAILKPELKLTLPSREGELLGPINLVQAIEYAWENQPDVNEALGRLRQAEGNVAGQRSTLLPNINLSSTLTRTSTGAGGGSVIVGNALVDGGSGNTNDRLQSRIGWNQRLFDFGRTRNLILQADLLRQSAAADVLSSQNDTALNVKLGLYTLIRANRLMRVRENDLANRNQQLELARALYDAGELAAGDVVRAQSAVTSSVVSVNSARLDFENARQDLLEQIGLPPLSPISFVYSSESELELKEVAALLEQANKSRPDLLAAQRDLEARKAALGAAYALNKPELSAFTGITFQGDINQLQVPTFTAQLALSFDLYDGGARAGAVTSAEGQITVSEAQLKRTKLAVERLVGSVVAQLQTAERNVEAARAGIGSAREGVRIAEGRYRVALGTLTDVLDAQTAYVQAEINLTNAWAEVNFARARLRHALAAPFEEGFKWEPMKTSFEL